jgi:hypothetical protein
VREHYFTTSTLPAKMFNEWANEFMFRAVERNAPDHPDMMLLDWIEIEYPSYYRAENDWLEFTGPPLIKDLPGPYKGWLNPLTLETFRSVPVWVLDLTTGRRQVLPIGRHWKLKERDYYNAFLPVANPGDRYVAYAPRALHKPASIKWTPADRLRASRIGAEYLVITHEKFLAEARRLADHRRKNGLRSEVVTTDEIANAFNKGFSNQVGIRNFIRYAYWNWKPGPRFVLLVGDATWDDKGLTGSEFANYLPTHYYGSDALGYYASDNWFAQMDDADDFPDVAIGRLPARSVADARAYVDKVIEQETAPTSGPWRNSALLLTSYNRQSQLLMDRLASSTLQGMRLKKSYTTPQQLARPDLPSTVTRQFGEGHAVVVFAGHGGSFVWQVGGNTGGTAALALFSPANVKKLGNKGKYPLVLALTCYTNSFDNPMQQTIGESLVLEPNRGAIAVVSASWRGALENEFPLAAVLLRRLREGSEKTIGEALMAAKREDMRPENVNCVCLLGDPAATVPLAPPAAAPPAAPSVLAKK